MHLDVYETNRSEAYVLILAGETLPILSSEALQQIGETRYFKTIESSRLKGFDLPQIESEIKESGYAVRKINRRCLDSAKLSESLNEHLKLALAPEWFAVFLALVYVAGFLSLYIFLDRFGIHETSEEFFKSRYIHVGILFMLFPVCIVLPIFLIGGLKKTELGNENKNFRFPVTTILSFFNLCLVFYILLYTPQDFLMTQLRYLGCIVVFTFAGPRFGDLAVKILVKNNR